MTTFNGKAEIRPAGLAERIPPHLFFVASALFHYLGPAFAVLLFARVPLGGVAWLRIVSAAVIFAVWRKPWRSFFGSTAGTKWEVVALGTVFALMNYSFYVAIDRLPLGTVAAIEFVGPILLALGEVERCSCTEAQALAAHRHIAASSILSSTVLCCLTSAGQGAQRRTRAQRTTPRRLGWRHRVAAMSFGH